MAIANAHMKIKIKMKLLSQEGALHNNASSLNHTKYSSSLNEVCETAPSLSYIHPLSNKSKKLKSKFLKENPYPQATLVCPKPLTHRPRSCFNPLPNQSIPHHKPVSTRAIRSFTFKAQLNCLDIMKNGLTENNMRNSLLMTIASIKQKGIRAKRSPNANEAKVVKNQPRKRSMPEFKTSNSKYSQYLTHDLKYKFDIPFSLVKSIRFKPKNRLIHDLDIANYDEMNALAIKKTLEDNFKIEGTVCSIAKEITHQERRKTNLLLINKFIRVLIRAAIDFQQLHIGLEEFYSSGYAVTVPFQNKDSQRLIQCVKDGNCKEVDRLVSSNKYLVRDFDYCKLTALHWAAKRNVFKVISQFVGAGANVNAQDCIGRTPLHYAVKSSHLEAVLVLLYEMALPTIRDKEGKLPSDYTKDYKVNYILKRTTTLHILHHKGKQKNYKKSIRTGLSYCYVNDLHLKFDLARYRIRDTADAHGHGNA